MFCTKCGKSIPDESAFCPECGQDLRPAAPAQPQNVIEVQPAAVSTYESLAEPTSDAGAAAAAADYSNLQGNYAGRPASYAVQQPNSTVQQANNPVQQTYNPVQQTNSTGQTSKSSSDIGSKIGAFFKEYFKNPIAAVSSHAKQEFWLWGLVSICAYLLIQFLVSLVGTGSFVGFGIQFGYFIGNIARFATLVFAYYLFQGVFKLKKKSLTSIIAAVGLAFLPILPVYLVGLIFDRIITFSSIQSGLMTAVYVVAGIILYSELKESSDDKDGVRSLLTIAVAIACMPIISGIIDAIVYRVMYLPYNFPYIY